MSYESSCEGEGGEKGKMPYKTARSFLDLEVYQNTYKAALLVNLQIIPKLLEEEKYSLKDQMRRSSKAIPALIAEGYAKKNHQKDWQKYLDDAIGECNEMITHLSFTKDLFSQKIDISLCDELIKTYDVSGKQLFSLGRSWKQKLSSP